MTFVHFHLADAAGRGLDGSVSLVPTRRVTVRDVIRLPVAQTVRLDKGEATVEVMPSTTQWVWRVIELVAAGGRRYVEVPDSDKMVEYAGLVDVDPATLGQSSETVAAWETATRAAQSALDQIESIDDKVARAERLAQAASDSAAKAKDSETAASASAASAAADAQSANTSASTATGKAQDAAISADKAKASETAAKTSETASAEHADAASAAASEAEKIREQLRKWFPAATTRTDLWLEPVDFAVAGPYKIPDQPTIKIKPVAAYLDGHTSDVDATLSTGDTNVATIDGQTLTWASNPTTLLAALKSDGYKPAEVTIKAGDTTVAKHVYLQADQPDGAVGDLWVRTEKLHNGLRYYTGAYGTAPSDANSMFFLVDRPREIWRKTIDGWNRLTGKELS